MSTMVVYLDVLFRLSTDILDVKSKGRLGRVESATNGLGIRLFFQLPMILKIQQRGYD